MFLGVIITLPKGGDHPQELIHVLVLAQQHGPDLNNVEVVYEPQLLAHPDRIRLGGDESHPFYEHCANHIVQKVLGLLVVMQALDSGNRLGILQYLGRPHSGLT